MASSDKRLKNRTGRKEQLYKSRPRVGFPNMNDRAPLLPYTNQKRKVLPEKGRSLLKKLRLFEMYEPARG